jgi:hypothetical protein
MQIGASSWETASFTSSQSRELARGASLMAAYSVHVCLWFVCVPHSSGKNIHRSNMTGTKQKKRKAGKSIGSGRSAKISRLGHGGIYGDVLIQQIEQNATS